MKIIRYNIALVGGVARILIKDIKKFKAQTETDDIDEGLKRYIAKHCPELEIKQLSFTINATGKDLSLNFLRQDNTSRKEFESFIHFVVNSRLSDIDKEKSLIDFFEQELVSETLHKSKVKEWNERNKIKKQLDENLNKLSKEK